jgi:hypothetical protein
MINKQLLSEFIKLNAISHSRPVIVGFQLPGSQRSKSEDKTGKANIPNDCSEEFVFRMVDLRGKSVQRKPTHLPPHLKPAHRLQHEEKGTKARDNCVINFLVSISSAQVFQVLTLQWFSARKIEITLQKQHPTGFSSLSLDFPLA